MKHYIFDFNLNYDLSGVDPLLINDLTIKCTPDQFLETFNKALIFKNTKILRISLLPHNQKFSLELPSTILQFEELLSITIESNYYSRNDNIHFKISKEVFELPNIEDIYSRYIQTTLPECLDNKSNLKVLSIDNALDLPKNLDQLERLETFNIRCNTSNRLKVLSGSITKCSSLKVFNIQDFDIEELPTDFDQFENLNELTIKDCRKLKALPDSIIHLKKISLIGLESTSIRHLPKGFGTNLSARSLYIRNTPLEALPEALYSSIITSITLINNKLTNLDFRLFKISGLNQILIDHNDIEIIDTQHYSEDQNESRLKKITLNYVILKEFPDCFHHLTALDNFIINNKIELDYTGIGKIKTLSELDINNVSETCKRELFEIKKLKKFNYLPVKSAMKFKDSERLTAILTNSNLPFAIKDIIFNLLQGKKRFKSFSLFELLASATISHKYWLKAVIPHISKKIEEQNKVPLDANSNIYVLGKLSTSKTEFKEKFSPYFKISNRYSDQVTHIVLGHLPKEVLKLEGKELTQTFLYETELNDYTNKINPGYIIEESEQNEEINSNIQNLLVSKDEASQLIALEMLKSGGIPKGILNELFFIQKTTNSSTIRRAVTALLKANAPKEMMLAINDRSGIRNPDKYREYELYSKLNKLKRNWGKEIVSQLAYNIYQKYGKGLRFIVVHGKTTPIWEKVIPIFLNNGVLNWTTALGYNVKTDIPENNDIYTFTNAKPLPIELIKEHKITNLILHNTNQESIPESIGEFKDVEILDLSYNYIHSLPKSILNLKKLKEIDLRYNTIMSHLPTEIYELSTLEIIHVSDQMIIEEDKLKSHLPNCQIIKYKTKETA